MATTSNKENNDTDGVERDRWRQEFERTGARTLRLLIADPWQTLPDECRRYARVWLSEQDAIADAQEEKRYRTIRGWTIVAGVAGIIAAVTGIIAAVTGIIAVWR